MVAKEDSLQESRAQNARARMDDFTELRVLVLMHVRMGSQNTPLFREVEATLLTKIVGEMHGVECTFAQHASESPAVFTKPPGVPNYWNRETQENLIRHWTRELPWGALTEIPLSFDNPLNSIRLVVSSPGRARPLEAGFTALLDFMFVYGALVESIGSSARNNGPIKGFLVRLQGLRNAVERDLTQRLQEIHKVRM